MCRYLIDNISIYIFLFFFLYPSAPVANLTLTPYCKIHASQSNTYKCLALPHTFTSNEEDCSADLLSPLEPHQW